MFELIGEGHKIMHEKKDETGKVYGNLTVLRQVEDKVSVSHSRQGTPPRTEYLVRCCLCNRVFPTTGFLLRRGEAECTGCGRHMYA